MSDSSGNKMPELNIYQPWSAPLLHTSLPDKVVQELIQLTDLITKDEKYRESGSKNLAGEIEDEWTIDPILLTNISFKNYIKQLCWEYLKVLVSQHPKRHSFHSLSDRIENIEITSSWFNNQKDNEYNPVHFHSGTFSGVLYLKIPEYLPARKNDYQDGSICFVGNTSSSDDQFTSSTFSILPKVGDIFLFPSSLRHQVYPFRTKNGKGIRRSLSFNLNSPSIPHPTLS